MSLLHTYKPPTMYTDVVIKLGLEKGGNDQTFRRITSFEFKGEDDPIQVLKTHAVLLSLSVSEKPEDFCLEDHAVTLTYRDSDGDKVLIHSRDDLLAAMREHFKGKKLKILARVQKNVRTAASRARLASVESATQTTSTNTEPRPSKNKEQRKSYPFPVQDVVEDILGIIVGAASAVQANVLDSGTPDHRRVEPSVATVASPVVTTAETSTEAPHSESTSKSPEASSGEEEPTTMEEETSAQEEDVEPPFIHGRHTCDGCLTTPIVGKRFHAVNKADYDLCQKCRNNYKGTDIAFEEAELDRDRSLQERWQRRHALITHRAKNNPQRKSPKERQADKHGNGHHSDHVPPAQRRYGRSHCRGRNCGPRGGRRPLFGPPHGPPHHMHPPHGPPHHGPFCPPHGPPPHWPFSPPHGSPPPFQPWDPPHGPPPPFPPCGHPPFFGPHVPPPSAPPAEPAEFDDLALNEAIRRSMEDVVETKKETVEEPALKVNVQPISTEEMPASEPSAPVEVEPPTTDGTEEPSRSDETKNSSFASDAEGCGDVATGLGEALDKVAGAIDSLNLELNRTESKDDSEMTSCDEPDVIVDAECAVVDSTPTEVGATIVDGEDVAEEVASQSSWQVVVDQNNQADEALARAAQVIGSALFNSDISHQEEIQRDIDTMVSQGSAAGSSPADMMSSVTSVPSTVPSINTTGQVTSTQRERWALQLEQLHELGFFNDSLSIDILERLTAANIGVNELTTEVNVERVVNEMMKDW